MPDDPRISQLLDRLSGPLSLDTLEALTKEFDSLAQDRADTLPFFVLQNVCQRLASALEGEAVDPKRFEELTAGMLDGFRDIVVGIQQHREITRDLEQLVVKLFQNLGLYRA
ncbi:MAG: ASCH domain-containing protein [Chthoniobacterales bacterium]|nr:ASCH domain-containing protein [Chthoniobacterales bacterium]